MTEPGRPPYEVHFSRAVAERLRRLQRRASRAGRGDLLIHALRTIVHRLRHEPLTFGEPLYRLPALRLQVRCAVVRPLVIDFGVHEDRPVIYVKGVQSLEDPS